MQFPFRKAVLPLSLLVFSLVLGSPALSFAASIRITGISAIDDGQSAESGESTPSVDVVRNVCTVNDDLTEVLEPFFDTVLAIQIVNDDDRDIRITRFRYTIRNADGNGNTFRSRAIAPSGGLIAEKETTTTFSALFLDVQDSQKFFNGSSTAIPQTLGFRNVQVELRGRDSNGRLVIMRSRFSLSFDDFDRCT